MNTRADNLAAANAIILARMVAAGALYRLTGELPAANARASAPTTLDPTTRKRAAA